MRKVVLAVTMTLLVPGVAPASTPTFSVGPFGPPNPIASGRDVCFSMPGDLNGLLGSSEIIGQFGLESRVASDFSLTTDATICLARWWGGYYNNTVPCVGGNVSVFNLYFYESADCLPAEPPITSLVVNPTITYLSCQAGANPIYQYEATVSQPLQADRTYWFVAQAADHTFPPEWGRLSAIPYDYGPCGSAAFWSPYFGYPEWTLNACGLDPCPEMSAEFECCQPTPIKEGSWGRIKSLYR
jgi:hypothetical protein